MNTIHAWEDIGRLPVSEFQHGSSGDAADALTGNLYEEPLLTQSNARILIGHAVNGTFRFAALPAQVYPVPVNYNEFGYYQGMYYHTDNALYAGDLEYSLISGGKTVRLSDATRNARTRYALSFLPVTATAEGNLRITITSCAPTGPYGKKDGAEVFQGIALPGPAGALYTITLENVSAGEERGILRLRASDKLIGDYEDLKPEIWKNNAAAVRIRRGVLMLSRPEGSVGVYLQGGKASLNDGCYISELSYYIPAGQSRTFCTYIALGLDYNSITPCLYDLLRRDPLDWIAGTIDFWGDRLPRLELSAPDADDISARTQEFYTRCLLDNFNCLQTDADGNLLAHRQGAPSHGYGTIWGIDFEPTIISTAIICPELAERALVFILDKTRPPGAWCAPNHSVPILCAPVVIAAFMLRHTGDTGMFTRTPSMLGNLTGIMDEILNYKHQTETLFSTYWSSDGLVGRRYDYGTNIKLFYAFDGMAYILSALGKDGGKYHETARGILQSIEKTMIVEGPFGPMFSGGTNLDVPHEGLFIPDNRVPYYDGEDTATMLTPVYGAYKSDYPPLVNYQRFGRSLFCQNYQSEIDIRSWYTGNGIAHDGTAVLASLAGAVSRQEMIDTAKTAIHFIDPVTGSLFWWPSGPLECRKLTRCSQGQGAWAWFYRNCWLGIETDGVSRILTIAPRGLPNQIHIFPAIPAGFPFEVEFDEAAGTCRIRSYAGSQWEIRVGFRGKGQGAEGKLEMRSQMLQPGETAILTMKDIDSPPAAVSQFSIRDIYAAELDAFMEEGILFCRRGGLWYWFNNGNPPFDLRFVLGNGTGADWEDVTVRLCLPPGCSASVRVPGTLRVNDAGIREYGEVCYKPGPVKQGERKTAAFVFHMPTARKAESNDQGSRHYEQRPVTCDALIETGEITEPDIVTLTAVLEAVTGNREKIRRTLTFKAGYIPVKPASEYNAPKEVPR